MTPINIRPEAFPGLLCELARACGPAAAFALADLAGGTRLYVPHHVDPAHRLARHLGRDAAGWLSAQYPGEFVVVPNAARLRDWLEMVALRQRGLSQPAIARRMRRTVRNVKRVLARLPAGVAAGVDPFEPRPRPCPMCGHLHRPRPIARAADPDPRQYALPL